MSTDTSLESAMDENGYPPWQSGRSEKNDGCLLFDRHMDNKPSFVETRCDRKRDFICEKYPKDETSDWLNKPIKFTYDDSIYVIYPTEKTWQESNAFCNKRDSVLAHINDINITNLIVEAMGDHPKVIIIDVKHISRYLEILVRMKTTGNRIVAIGFFLEDDWELLLTLASIGFDRRKNLYLFNMTEFDMIINELRSFKTKTLKCPTRETDLINVPSEKNTNNSTTIHTTEYCLKRIDNNQNINSQKQQDSSENEDSKDQGLKSKKNSRRIMIINIRPIHSIPPLQGIKLLKTLKTYVIVLQKCIP